MNLPSGSRKMNNNQSYHNTDLYSYSTLADISRVPPSRRGHAVYSGGNEFWLRSPAKGINYFSDFSSESGQYCIFSSSQNDAGVVLAFAF